MSLTLPQTPQRPLPGLYPKTPAPPPPQFALGPSIYRSSPNVDTQSSAQNASSRQQQLQVPPAQQQSAASGAIAQQGMTPTQRAARTINETLAAESRYPELDSYVSRKMQSGIL